MGIKKYKDWKVYKIAQYGAVAILLLTICTVAVENTLTLDEKDLNLNMVNNQIQYNVDLLGPVMLESDKSEKPVRHLEAAIKAFNEGSYRFNDDVLELRQPPQQVNDALLQLEKSWKTYKNAPQKEGDKYLQLKAHSDTLDHEIEEYLTGRKTLANVLLTILKLLMGVMVAIIFIVGRSKIFFPLKKMHLNTKEMIRGNLEKAQQAEENESEVGRVSRNINLLAQTLKHAGEFTRQIEKGNLDAEYKKIHEAKLNENSLEQSLVRMRDKMKETALEDERRRWANEGITEFVELLRSDRHELGELSDNILSSLVKYLKANQGALFVVEDHEQTPVQLSMVAAYAYERKKYLSKTLQAGQGLVGQTYLEGETIFLTEIPDNYVEITSGLGEATPKCLLLVPMKVNEQIMGVIEIASFHPFEKYQIEFVEKLGENIASTIASVKTNEKTRSLLEESQQMAEQMRAQEEEMRQNMEEMAATQEEMNRKQTQLQEAYEQMSNNEKTLQEKEANLNGILNSTEDSIASIDTEYRVIVANKVLQDRYTNSKYTCNKGDYILESMKEDVAKEWKAYYDRALAGERFDFVLKSSVEGEDTYRHYYLNPIYEENNKIAGASIVSRDVTEEKHNELRIQKLLDEAQEKADQLGKQEEMMKQQMQELMAAQTEMKAVERNLSKKENDLNGIINNTEDSILLINKDYDILVMNDTLKSRYKDTQYEKMGVGDNVLDMLEDHVRDEWVDYYERSFMGEKLKFTIKSTVKGEDSYREYEIHPVRNHEGEIYAITIFSRDVTARKTLELENLKLRKK